MSLGEWTAIAIDWELGEPAQRFSGQRNFASDDRRHAKTSTRMGARKRIDSHRMARVMTFVSSHIAENFTVADLAAVACMSPAHFARSFKATTGQCPHEFVARIRLALAKQMLAAPQLPISDIALSTGFSSQSNFSRAFRGATGMTPRDYRASSAVFE